MPRQRTRNGGYRQSVRMQPKKAAARPTRTFTRTLRQNQVLPFNNTSGNLYATISAIIRGDPRSFVDWEAAATPFEMFRVKRLRVFALPSCLPSASLETLFRNVSSTQMWTCPDYTSDENALGFNIKSYQNTRFHGLSLNAFTKIVDTDVRLNSQQGGVLPPSTWLPTNASTTIGGWDPTVLNYSGTQVWIENPALLNVSPSLQASVSLTLELDIEFKQPGFSSPPTSVGLLPARPLNQTGTDENDEFTSPSSPVKSLPPLENRAFSLQ